MSVIICSRPESCVIVAREPAFSGLRETPSPVTTSARAADGRGQLVRGLLGRFLIEFIFAAGHRRFWRRSQFQNSWSQRRQVVGPAYGLCFGALCWGLFRFIDVLSQAQTGEDRDDGATLWHLVSCRGGDVPLGVLGKSHATGRRAPWQTPQPARHA
jgi:hypothetical protein